MAKPKKIKDEVRVSFVLLKAQAEWGKHMAFQMSVQEKRMISASEAMRMDIETVIQCLSSWIFFKRN